MYTVLKYSVVVILSDYSMNNGRYLLQQVKHLQAHKEYFHPPWINAWESLYSAGIMVVMNVDGISEWIGEIGCLFWVFCGKLFILSWDSDMGGLLFSSFLWWYHNIIGDGKEWTSMLALRLMPYKHVHNIWDLLYAVMLEHSGEISCLFHFCLIFIFISLSWSTSLLFEL